MLISDTNRINGVPYIVTGGGGSPLTKVYKEEFTAVAKTIYHFVEFEVAGPKVKYRAISNEGDIFDATLLSG